MIYKNVPNYENYSVSDTGFVCSNKTGKVLKGRITQKGYLSVVLYNSKGNKSFRVHRLILSVFTNTDYTDCKLECGHKDDDKKNNNLSNLVWQTRKENMNWNGLQSRMKRVYVYSELRALNSKKATSKKISRISKDGSEVFYDSIHEAIKEGFNGGNISACCLGKRKMHKGFRWNHIN